MLTCAPILISVYDRLSHFTQCIESLKLNELASDSVLYIASDAAYKPEHEEQIASVRSYITTITGFKDVVPIIRPTNFGASRSSLDARERVLRNNSSFIRLEDDIVTAKYFLRYLNEGLDYYYDDKRILAICAYSVPIKIPALYKKTIYLGRRFSPWGFAMWKDRLEKIDFSERDRYTPIARDRKKLKLMNSIGTDYLELLKADSSGVIQANDVRLCYQQLIDGMYCVFPTKSLSKNIGFDGSGIHCESSSRFNIKLESSEIYPIVWKRKIQPNKKILFRFMLFQNQEEGVFSFYYRRLANGLKKTELYLHLKKFLHKVSRH